MLRSYPYTSINAAVAELILFSQLPYSNSCPVFVPLVAFCSILPGAVVGFTGMQGMEGVGERSSVQRPHARLKRSPRVANALATAHSVIDSSP